MSSSERGQRNWINIWWPVALGICVILLESTESLGADHTSGPLRRFFTALFGPVCDAQWYLVHHYIRKTGHFFGYGLIGLAWLRAWWLTLPHSRLFQDVLLALLGTAAIASFDEWHQTFLPNRTGSPFDVMIDCTGAITLQLIVYLYMCLFQTKKLVHTASSTHTHA
jgi:VanZ family protein